MSTDFEDKYLDVLQDVESALADAYATNSKFVDTGALYVIETLIKFYTEEQKGRAIAIPPFEDHEQIAFDSVKERCEWRLGRSVPAFKPKARFSDELNFKKTPDEIVVCLKRIKKSIESWKKRSVDRRAYYNFIKGYV